MSGGVAIVTGGASGIGRAIAEAFLAEKRRVVIIDLPTSAGAAVAAEIGKGDSGACSFLPCDVSKEDALKAAARQVEDAVGPAEALVNSAGIIQNKSSIESFPLAEHDRIWDVNYRGAYLCCREFGGYMARRGRGAIVNIASISGMRAKPLMAYSPAKAALIALTEMLACDLGAHGVRVNAVSPGYTLSPALRSRIAAGQRDPEAIKSVTALRHLIAPEEIAPAVVFLCSPGAAVITGVNLPIDAGWLANVTYRSYPA